MSTEAVSVQAVRSILFGASTARFARGLLFETELYTFRVPSYANMLLLEWRHLSHVSALVVFLMSFEVSAIRFDSAQVHNLGYCLDYINTQVTDRVTSRPTR